MLFYIVVSRVEYLRKALTPVPQPFQTLLPLLGSLQSRGRGSEAGGEQEKMTAMQSTPGGFPGGQWAGGKDSSDLGERWELET